MKVIIDKIIQLITALSPESTHADYEKIIKPYHAYFNNLEFVTCFFAEAHAQFAKYKIPHDVYSRSESLSYVETVLLEKRVELLLFIFDFLLPQYEQGEKDTDIYLHLLWMDMTCLFSSYNLRFYSNPMKELLNLNLINTVKKYRGFFLEYQGRYVRLINNILNNGALHLEASALLNIKSNLRYGFISIIVNEFHYACHLQLLGNINGASECLERAHIYLFDYLQNKDRIFKVSQATPNDIALVDESIAKIKLKINSHNVFIESILEMAEKIYILADQNEYEAVNALSKLFSSPITTTNLSAESNNDFETFILVSSKMCSALSTLSNNAILFERLEKIAGFPEVFFIPELHILNKALPKEKLLTAVELTSNAYKELGRFFETIEQTGFLHEISGIFKTLSVLFKEAKDKIEKATFHPVSTSFNTLIITNTISYLESEYIKQYSTYESLAIYFSQNDLMQKDKENTLLLDSLINQVLEVNNKITTQNKQSLLERDPRPIGEALEQLASIIAMLSINSKIIISIPLSDLKSLFKQLATTYISLRKYFDSDHDDYRIKLINNRFAKLARYCFDHIQYLDQVKAVELKPKPKFLAGIKIAPDLTFQDPISQKVEKTPIKKKVAKKSPPKQTYYFPPVPKHSPKESPEVKSSQSSTSLMEHVKAKTKNEGESFDYLSFGLGAASSKSKKEAPNATEEKKPSKSELKALKKEKKIKEGEMIAFKEYAKAVLPTLEIEEQEITSKLNQLDLNSPKIESIPIPESIKDILIKLNQGGFKSYLYGGFVRDSLLKIQPNDYDIVTNNPNVGTILGSKCLKMLHKKDSYKFSTNVDINFDTELNLAKLAENRDLKLNAFFADIEGQVSDPLNYYSESLLKSPNLEMIGDLSKRLEEDPSRILRIIRLSFHVKKNPPEFFLDHLRNLGDMITSTLPFGIYAKQLENLFTNKNKAEIVNYFIDNNLFGYLLPSKIREGFHEKIIVEYCPYLKSVILDPEFKKPKINRYHLLALLVLPELLKNRASSPSQIITLFCNGYLGPDMNQEKALIINRTGALLTNYLESYLEFCKPKTFTPGYQVMMDQGNILTQAICLDSQDQSQSLKAFSLDMLNKSK